MRIVAVLALAVGVGLCYWAIRSASVPLGVAGVIGLPGGLVTLFQFLTGHQNLRSVGAARPGAGIPEA